MLKNRYAVRCKAMIALFLIASSPALSQTLRVSLDQLTSASDAVVLGQAVSTESFWTPDSTAILTHVSIRVDEQLLGSSSGMQVVTIPGGRVGNYLHEVSDMPSFDEDEEVAVFLTRHASGAMIVTGGAQGKLMVTKNPVTGERQVMGAEYMLDERANTGAASGAAPWRTEQWRTETEEVQTTLPLSEFVRRVKEVNQATGVK